MNAVIDVQNLKKPLIKKPHYKMFPLLYKKEKYLVSLVRAALENNYY